MADRVSLHFGGGSADQLTVARGHSAIFPRVVLLGTLLLIVGCATAPAQPPPTPVALADRTDEAPAQVRHELDQATRRLDAVAGRAASIENALARLDARVETLEKRFDHLTSELAQARASRSPSTAGGALSPPSAGTPAPGPATPGQVPGSPASPKPAPVMAATTPEDLYTTGFSKFRAGELDAAVLIFYDLITGFPRHPLRETAQFLVADIYFTQKDLRSALSEFEGLLAAVPNGAKTAETLLKIGQCQRGLGDEPSARKTWQRLIKEYPNSAPARQARVLLYRR